jgi:prepilin-type processing-associated H-X9-DG protein
MITAIGLVTLAFGQFGSSISESALVDGDKVHILLPPVLVAEGRWLHSSWSDDGRSLLVVTERIQVSPDDYKDWIERRERAQAKTEVSVSVANMRTGKAKTLWTGASVPSGGAYIAWFRNADVALVQIESGGGAATILRVTAGTSKVELIETLPRKAYLTADPTGKYVAVTPVVESPEEASVRFVGGAGAVLKRQPLSFLSTISFTKSGVAVMSVRSPGRYRTVTPGGGEQWVDGKPDFVFSDEDFGSSRVSAQTESIAVPFLKEKVKVLYARCDESQNRVLVAFNSDWTYSGETESGFFYVISELNLVRPIIQVSKAAYESMLASELRAETMARLNQVGKALMMFAGDNADRFPTKEELDGGAVQGYLGDSTLTQGFVYHGITSPGANPARTAAGYALCPGGRAVLFQDGHVEFIPDR